MPSVAPIGRSRISRPVLPKQLSDVAINRSWDSACQFWSIFNFTRPTIIRNLSQLPAEEIHRKDVAFINLAEQRVTVVLPNLRPLGLDLLPVIFKHELGHKFCPQDLKTFLLINSAAKREIDDETAASSFGNLYRDMLVNVDIHRRGEHEIAEVYRRLWQKNPDDIQQIIGRAYERLFQRQDTSKAYAQTIIQTKPRPVIEEAAAKVMEIILNSRRSNWLKMVREFTKVLKPFAKSMSQEAIYVISNMQANDFSPPGKSPIPPKGKADLKELEKRLGGVVFDLRQLEGEEDGQPCSFPEFKKFLGDSKINVTEEEALIWYYRDLISGRVVKVPEVSVSSGRLFPFAPRTWNPGDPIHDLDVVLTISVGGLVIPGVTTKKWEWKRGHHLTVGRDYPDLDLIIDGSGSMEDPAKVISHAVTSGMIVAKSFLATRKAVRVTVFSGKQNGDTLFETTGEFIRDEDAIDRKIIKYFDGATVLPMDEIEKPYRADGKPKYLVMITDLQIQQVTPEVVQKLDFVFKRSVGATVFLIGERETERKLFVELGFNVVPVKKIVDLEGHALQLTRQLLEERLLI